MRARGGRGAEQWRGGVGVVADDEHESVVAQGAAEGRASGMLRKLGDRLWLRRTLR